MSMLAGPRRKQTIINLRAKNNAWSNDTNKFGQRMLEKMGWSSGKGLGAKENGMIEHVVVQFKNDEKGLGYKEKDDQWTKQEEDYNTLLTNLSKVHNQEDTQHSLVSLEEKSKKSRARIHYHKFTRGKDVSRYSEKDLAAIFGKKTLSKESVEKPSKVESNDEVFFEKGSMEDYFKNKASKLKRSIPVTSVKNDSEYVFKGFAGTDEPQLVIHQDSELIDDKDDVASIKISNKIKKSKHKYVHSETDDTFQNCTLEIKKKKKVKSTNEITVEENEPVKTKSKKKKLLQQEVELGEADPANKSKKHKKNKSKHSNKKN